jgi:hypothetical protein
MFHNKNVGNDELHDKIIWLAAAGPNYKNRIYNIIISNIETSKQYDRYYVLNSDMLFFDKNNNVVVERTYIDIMEESVNNVINNEGVIADVKSGNALLIFDFGSEIVPLSIDQTTMYGIINDHFQKIGCTDNVVYWTMYESPYDLVDRKMCVIDIVSVSLSTIRYIGFNYDTYKELTQNNDITRKSAVYLNRRMRPHRTKLLIECIERGIDFDDMYFSFMGTESKIDGCGNDVAYNIDMTDLLTTKVVNTQMSRSSFEKMVNEFYGKRIAMEDKEIIEWLGSSDIDRVTELLNHRAKSKFEIITEYSCTDTDISISEKLSLPILSKIPFVVAGDKGYLNHLKKLGFKTFDKFWSEEYDRCSGDERIKKLASTIDSICHDVNICEEDEYGNSVYSHEMSEILEYNYNHYKDVYSQRVSNRILRSVCKTDNIDVRYDMKDKIWYNKNRESLFVTIPGNRSEFFEDEIAPLMGYKLVHRGDMDNLDTRPTYVAIRNPISRVEEQLHATSLTLDGFIKQHSDTDRGRLQSSFVEGLNIQGIIDLDNLIDSPDAPRHTLEHLNHCFWYDIDKKKNPKYHWSTDDREKVTKAFVTDFEFYEKYKLLGKKIMKNIWQFSPHYAGPNIRDELHIHLSNFAENYTNIYNCESKIETHRGPFLEAMTPEFWYYHTLMLEKVGLINAPKDISILDIGTQLGIMPHFLTEYGFKNVECTNSSGEASEHLYELETVWKEMDIEPKELHIYPKQEFELDKKYDLILCTHTNVLWNSNKLVKFHNHRITHDWYLTDADENSHAFFVPYNVDELKFFVSNIKKCLNEGGVAVIQPYPFVYHLPAFTEELEFLEQYQFEGRLDSTDRSDRMDNKRPDSGRSLHDYFVIRN